MDNENLHPDQTIYEYNKAAITMKDLRRVEACFGKIISEK